MARYGWLASYPKSGNTWLRLMLLSLQAGLDEVDINVLERRSTGLDRRTFDTVTGADSEDLTLAEIDWLRPFMHRRLCREREGLLLCRTHDRWRLAAGQPVIPSEGSAGILYIVRDPRDVAVSLAHYERLTIDAAIERLEDSRAIVARQWALRPELPQPLGTWSEHVTSWLDDCPDPCRLVRYEDLRAAPEQALLDAARWLGLAAEPEMVRRIVRSAQIDRLQQQERQHGYRPRPATTQAFFRSGRTGEWKDAMTVHQAGRIADAHGAVMRRLGYL